MGAGRGRAGLGYSPWRPTTSSDGCRMLHYWPILIYVPAVLLLLATLSFITGVVDRREKRNAQRR